MCHFLNPDDASTLALIGLELRAASADHCVYVESLVERLSSEDAKATGYRMMALMGCEKFAELEVSTQVDEAARIMLARAGALQT